MQKIEWMNDLKKGDYIIVQRRNEKRVDQVSGISKKSIFVGKQQFSKFDGLLFSERNYRPRFFYPITHRTKLVQATDKELNSFKDEKEEMVKKLKGYNFDELSYNQMLMLLRSIEHIESDNLNRK